LGSQSSIQIQQVIASSTSGAARLANGQDDYSLTVSLVGTNGQRMLSAANRLSIMTPGVELSGVTDTGGGTYALSLTSSTPGNYTVTVLLDGLPVGTPMAVNFIGADVIMPAATFGQAQTVDGLGFLPGERVTVTLHSTPIDLGTFTADSKGTVRVNFDIPDDLELGDHTVTFDGAKSGTAEVGFTVTEGALAPTGGAVVALSPGLWPVAAALSLATLLGVAITRRRLTLSAPRWRRQI